MFKKFSKVAAFATVTFASAALLTGCGTAEAEESATNTEEVGASAGAANTDPIRLVFYPNESGAEFGAIRDDMEELIYEATGREVTSVLTTDINIAIEAIASGQGELAWMGPDGYIQANDMNENVNAIMTVSGPSGTLDDALYFSFIAVREEDAKEWMVDGEFSMDRLAEIDTMSWVSTGSTSGFNVPGEAVMDHFDGVTRDDLAMPGGFWSQVLFGESHPGSAFNLLSGQADAASFLNLEDHFEHADGPLNMAGMVYQVRDNAPAPLDVFAGERIVIIHSVPVLNGPFVANSNNLTADEIEAIVAIFESDRVANNENFFGDPDSDGVSFRRAGGDTRFVRTNDEWYNPLRNR